MESAITEILKSIPLLRNSSTDSITTHFQRTPPIQKSFSNGEIIFSPAQSSKCIGFILDGSAKVYPNCGDEKTLLKTMSRGDLFGISNLYSDSLFPSIIIAEKSTSVLFIDSDAFKCFIESDTEALREYLKFLSRKILYLNKKIATFSAGSADAKLALYLLENEQNGTLNVSTSMSELATTLSVGRASLYRAFDKLTELRLIERDGSVITIIDSNGLESLFDNHITI